MAHLLDSEGYYYSVGAYLDGGAFGNYGKSNAIKLASQLMSVYGWTLDAASAWFGAVTYESQFNPAQIEGNLTTPAANSGVGYIQWTPSSQLISFCESWGVDWKLTSSQLRKWELERTTTDTDIKQWFLIKQYLDLYQSEFPTGKYPPRTMMEFTHSTLAEYTAREMSAQVIEFYTRPGSWQNTDNWTRNAEAMLEWREIISGSPVPPPTPVRKNKKWWLMLRNPNLY